MQAPWGPALRCTALQPLADHVFTAATLTLREDEQEWDALAAFVGMTRQDLQLLHQVHGPTIVRVDRAEPVRPTADGAVTGEPAVALVVRVADCAPLLMADRRSGAVAAVHAGWRSTMQEIGPAAVDEMRRQYGTRPEDLVVAIGPSRGGCCGERGEEVVEAFRAAEHSEVHIDAWFTRQPGRKPHFDLWRANRDQLIEAGVSSDAIHVAGLCTRSYPDVFHSYRARGTEAGRMAAVIRAAAS